MDNFSLHLLLIRLWGLLFILILCYPVSMTDDTNIQEPENTETQEVDPVLHLAELTLMAFSTYAQLNPPRVLEGDLNALRSAQQLQNILGNMAQLCDALGSQIVQMKPQAEVPVASNIILPS